MIALGGLRIIITFEGFRAEPYLCPAGVPTIGFGHTKGVSLDDSAMSVTDALSLLLEELEYYEAGVRRLINWPVTDNQFAALVSFAYNLGLGNLQISTLRRKLNRGDIEGASREFPKWRRANGKILLGLVRRRAAEQILFNT